MEILLSPKKERNNAICSSKAGPRDYHISEVSYLEIQIWYDIMYMWNLKYDKNDLIYEIEMDSQT